MEEEKIIIRDTPRPKTTRRPYNYWVKKYKPEYAEIASRMVASDFTEDDLAYMLGISVQGIKAWKHAFPQFKTACTDGKHNQVKRLVAKSMLEAAGYDYKTKKTRIIKDAEGNITKTEETEFDNHQAANNNLLIFLLCNLSSQLGLGNEENWKSRQKLEIENRNLNVTITGELVSEQIERLAGRLLETNPTKVIESKVINE